MRKKPFGVVFILCMIMMMLNLASVIWAVSKGNSIQISDIINIIVTIILGITTIMLSVQENNNIRLNLELDIKSHTPFFVIKSIIDDLERVKGYEVKDVQRIDTSLFDSGLYNERKVFVLVGFQENNMIKMDLVLKNGCETPLSEVRAQVYNTKTKSWEDNHFINPVNNMIQTVVKEHMQEVFEDLNRQHYQELFSNSYSNILPKEEFVLHMSLSDSNLSYPIEDTIKNNCYPEALFCKIKIVSTSIFGEIYEQEFDLGMRLFGAMRPNGNDNKYGYNAYKHWVIYEILKINTNVIFVEQDKKDKLK